jgi:hypothetical protein
MSFLTENAFSWLSQAPFMIESRTSVKSADVGVEVAISARLSVWLSADAVLVEML